MILIKTSKSKYLFEDARRTDITLLRKQGLELKKIGHRYKISGERVRQILLPPVDKITYHFHCDVCKKVMAIPTDKTPNCLNCQQSKILARGFKKIILEDIFKGKPAWKQEGRERNREIVRYLYDYTCQTCGSVWEEGQRSFDIHHLGGMCGKRTRSYDSLEDIDILLPLCHKCHFNHPEHTLKSKQYKKRKTRQKGIAVSLSTSLPVQAK